MSIFEIVGIAFGINIMIGILFYSLIIFPSMKDQLRYTYTSRERVGHFIKCVFFWWLAMFGIISMEK